MKTHPIQLSGVCLLLLSFTASAATFYVDLKSVNPLPPYSDWSSAATNIQDAVDASANGDLILVTNGVYQTGGRIMVGTLTNRVILNKAVTVQSINGPWVTAIQGSHTINGPAAVRCAWLTNNATLSGFTLRWGATGTSGDTSGGGVWCASSNAVVNNCLIVSNTAQQYGGGAYQGTFNNCLIYSNNVSSPGGGVCNAALNNCTVVSNASYGIYQTSPGTVHATNCIFYFNTINNYAGLTPVFSYCCTTPAIAGSGNFTTPPQLFIDNVHLTSTSPCIGAGTNGATGTDIFGNAWANPPSVGCAEWQPAPIIATPFIQFTGDPVGFVVGEAAVDGQAPFNFSWLKDGVLLQDNGHFSSTQTSNLVATGVSFADAGNYQLIVSNMFGVVTSSVAPLIVHCVDAAGSNPAAPYLDWTTAATNIQDAIAASTAGDVVLVTNGLYASGGKSMDGVITNRVSVDKAILVQSVNGANTTMIQGAWDPTATNGPAAMRCAWMTNNSVLSGFTLFGGATRSITSSPNQSMNGGGAFGTSNNAVVCNCVLATNFSSNLGGGAYAVTLNYCTLTGNQAFGSGMPGAGVANAGSGGGVAYSNLRNCLIVGNFAQQSSGGGAQNCNLRNCALTGNSAYLNGGAANSGSLVNCTVSANTSSGYSSGYGAAVYGATLTNCIVFGNYSRISYPNTNYASCTLAYCCADPLAPGTGNLDVDPQLLPDGIHLSATSPCIGTGNPGVVSGTDIDGQTWSNPPSIGCDEWQPAPLIAGQPNYQIGFPAHGLSFKVAVAGLGPFSYFWKHDGVPVQDDGHHGNSDTASMVVNRFGPEDAGAYQVVATNSFGAVTSTVVQVVIYAVDVAGANPVVPYSSWLNAANTIQDAINVAAAGDIVLVTNGIYAGGGMVIDGDLTNRIVLNKAITVISVNGYKATIIQGGWNPATTNGPGSVRCAWVGDGAVLNGFTLQNGATRATGDSYSGGPLESGGGVWFDSNQGFVSNCLLSNNAAIYGGGVAYGTLNNSLVVGNNAAYNGGGAYYSTLNNCTVVNNYIYTSGASRGAGTYSGSVRNSIVRGNYDLSTTFFIEDDYASFGGLAVYSYSSTLSGPLSGIGNIYTNPQFVDLFHISSTSPCIGAGSAAYASGYDLDDEPWNNPPSMGCDEVVVSNLVGPLSVSLLASLTNLPVSTPFFNFNSPPHSDFFEGNVIGHVTYDVWSFGDGSMITNSGLNQSHYWTNNGDYNVNFTAYNNNNPSGVAANIVVHVASPDVPQLQLPTLLTNGFQFQFSGQQNVHYFIQCTTNLSPPVAWQTLQAIYFNTQNTIQAFDSMQTNIARFYRVLAR